MHWRPRYRPPLLSPKLCAQVTAQVRKARAKELAQLEAERVAAETASFEEMIKAAPPTPTPVYTPPCLSRFYSRLAYSFDADGTNKRRWILPDKGIHSL